jgi:hypothetical protein
MKYLLEKNKLNPKQIKTLNNILSLGTNRPVAPQDFSEKIRNNIHNITNKNLEKWNNGNFYFNKNSYSSISKCEGIVLANKENNNNTSFMNSNIIVGNMSHKAIQISFTHKIEDVQIIINSLIEGMRESDKIEDKQFFALTDTKQSEIISQVCSRVTNYLDDWPPLQSIWSPRFEENISTKIGKLLLASRVDLIIGRPRSDYKRTILLVDFKSGNINDSHNEEALFYALVSTLRHEIMPWRSIVYSLASGEYTELDLNPDKLFEFSTKLSNSINKSVDLLLELEKPTLNPGEHCEWCPKSLSCSSSQAKNN